MIVHMVSSLKTKKPKILLELSLELFRSLLMRNGNVEHNIHHATSGNLDKRGVGDIWMMTVEEYIEASPMKRLSYRLYRNPIVMFGLDQLIILSKQSN